MLLRLFSISLFVFLLSSFVVLPTMAMESSDPNESLRTEIRKLEEELGASVVKEEEEEIEDLRAFGLKSKERRRKLEEELTQEKLALDAKWAEKRRVSEALCAQGKLRLMELEDALAASEGAASQNDNERATRRNIKERYLKQANGSPSQKE